MLLLLLLLLLLQLLLRHCPQLPGDCEQLLWSCAGTAGGGGWDAPRLCGNAESNKCCCIDAA